MKDIIKIQQKLVPEFVLLLEKRYNILRTIYYNEPLGRRALASIMGIGERIVRSEIVFLNEQGLINISSSGMTVTEEGEVIIEDLKDYIHELRGLNSLEIVLKEKLQIKNVVIVPGDVDKDSTVLNEIGRVAASYLASSIKSNSIIAITGGSTVREVIINVPKISNTSNVCVVPARGGIGKNVETQANTLTAMLAQRISAGYRLLHLPDNLSDMAIKTMTGEKGIKEILDTIHKADIIVYGIGRGDIMAERRGFNKKEVSDLEILGCVGEAFGYYFNMNGDIVLSTPTIGIKYKDIKNINTVIAVAGGSSKGDAIAATVMKNSNNVLFTDEGAARVIANL